MVDKWLLTLSNLNRQEGEWFCGSVDNWRGPKSKPEAANSKAAKKRRSAMRVGSAQGSAGRRNALLAIGAGGWLLGRAAFQGGVGTYFLGVTLHYLIAFS